MKKIINEYDTNTGVSKYVPATAGAGIDFLLREVYGPIYLDAIKELREEKGPDKPIRILEFGCGGGMNLIYIIKMLRSMNIPVDAAYGTDLSKKMIIASYEVARELLDSEDLKITKFVVASNEEIQNQLTTESELNQDHFNDYFDLIIGVNTFRYSWRNKKARETADQLYKMLSSGGRMVVIDMNQGFPYYLARLRNLYSKITMKNEEASSRVVDDLKAILYRNNDLPTLEEYVEPFRNAGFKISREAIFSWIGHSSSMLRLSTTRALAPILDKILPTHAMRVLVIGIKP